ncbi:MAG: asparagine synthase (glutamine-hydrolyzing) [Pseudomonadota bacterium]
MSAIAGILSLDRDSVEAEPAEAMVAGLAWRGPDDDGRYRSPDGRVALAARRLAGTDPSPGAALPLANETHDVWLVLDGEILNHRALRHSLELVGHRFRSNSDAEVALHAYEQWELDFPNHLQGSFALALWDDRRDRLVLARDTLGRKPLFWAAHGGRLAFASAIGPVLDVLGLPRRIDPDGLADLLALGCVPAPRTIAAGVSKLVPGGMLVAERDRPFRLRAWGSFVPDERRVASVRGLPLDRHAGNLRTLVECAVADRLLGDAPVGVVLDGGASGALAAIAGRLAGRAPPTFAVADAAAPDAAPAQDARLLAAAARSDLTEVRVGAEDALHALRPLVSALSEPVADSRALAGWFAARAARELDLGSLLAAEGADEVLLGHPAYRAARRSGVLERLVTLAPPLGRLLRGRRAGASDLPFPAGLTPFGEAGPDGLVPDRRAPSAPRPEPPPPPAWTGGDPLEALGLRDLRWRVADGLAPRADAAAQFHGLEIRLPFLDRQVVAYALSVPGPLRSPAGSPRLILRRALGDLMPPGFAARARAADPLPLETWMAGALGARLAEGLDGRGLVRAGMVAADAVRTLLARHRAEAGRAEALWTLLVLLEWADAHGFEADAAEVATAQRLAHSRS